MADIYHVFPINAFPKQVFDAISTANGLDSWWTKTCEGTPLPGAEYKLGFGPEYDWRAVVSNCIRDSEFELTFNKADADWQDSRINFRLTADGGKTSVTFQHVGWPAENEHYKISCFCWAMYLRLLKRYVETGETVPYEIRLEV
jgi:uncharacterized protein YndB with AHSA1/START domain